MTNKEKLPSEPKQNEINASDESGIYERYGLSTRSRVYEEYKEQITPALKTKISVCHFFCNNINFFTVC